MVDKKTEWGIPPRITSAEVDEYLERIALDPAATRKRKPDLALLTELQAAHLRAIPFDSTSIHLDDSAADDARVKLNAGKGMACDVEGVFKNVVRSRRGGYCFSVRRRRMLLVQY
jgi:arylamine N-acetyltransferase